MVAKLEWSIDQDGINPSILSVDELSEKEKVVLESRWDIIQFIIRESPGFMLFIKKHRALVIHGAVEKFDVSRPTVIKCIRLYLQGGKTKFSLMPEFKNCGAKGKDREYKKKPGAKPFVSQFIEEEIVYSDIVINATHKESIRKNIERRLINNNKLSIQKSYDLLIRDFYSFTNEIGTKIPYSIDKIPTFRQYSYQVERYRNENPERFQMKRDGERKFNLKGRKMLSNAVVDAFQPGYRYEVDATKPFIHLVDESRKNQIGTPVVYYVIDVYSNVIVGFYIGLEEASAKTATLALLTCLDNKVELCKNYDIKIREDEWFVDYLPQNMATDKGEFVGKFGNRIVDNLGILVETAASYRGDMKGTVERAFKITEDGLYGLIPGYEQKNFRSRGETDGRKHAKITLRELRQVYIHKFIEHNNKPMKNYKAAPEMIYDRLVLTPNNVWKWGVKNVGCGALKFDKERTRFLLMEEADASVTKNGVVFQGIGYTANIAENGGWFSEARILGRRRVKIHYDDRYLGEIYYLDKASDKIISFTQTPASLYEYGDMSMLELRHYKKQKKITRAISEDIKNKVTVKSDDCIEKDMQTAKNKYSEKCGVQKPSSKNKRENREIEKANDNENRIYIDRVAKQKVITSSSVESINIKELKKKKHREHFRRSCKKEIEDE
jgi:hypothetical protein